MIPQRPPESAHDRTERLHALVAERADTTADLQEDNTADLSLTTGDALPSARDSAALEEVETTEDVDLSQDILTAERVVTCDLAPLPRQRASGFFLFAACALIAAFLVTRPQSESHPKAEAVLARSPSVAVTQPIAATAAIRASREHATRVEAERAQTVNVRRDTANASSSVLSFESLSFATSEKAVSAVFIIKRMDGVRGRAVVQWAARSGSADAGIDFSDASGTARFADGQQQLAIYVPLRNDLLREKDETFRVCLRSAQHARIRGKTCAEATIRDDDGAAQTS